MTCAEVDVDGLCIGVSHDTAWWEQVRRQGERAGVRVRPVLPGDASLRLLCRLAAVVVIDSRCVAEVAADATGADVVVVATLDADDELVSRAANNSSPVDVTVLPRDGHRLALQLARRAPRHLAAVSLPGCSRANTLGWLTVEVSRRAGLRVGYVRCSGDATVEDVVDAYVALPSARDLVVFDAAGERGDLLLAILPLCERVLVETTGRGGRVMLRRARAWLPAAGVVEAVVRPGCEREGSAAQVAAPPPRVALADNA